MLKSKFAVAAVTAALVTAPVLTACGGQPNSSQSNASSASTEQTGTVSVKEEDKGSSSTALTDEDVIVETVDWGAEGELDDGSFKVMYIESRDLENVNDIFATLVLVDNKTNVAVEFTGNVTEDKSSGMSTIKDDESGLEMKFTTPDADPTTGEFEMDIDEHGHAKMKLVDNVDTVHTDIDKALAASDKSVSELSAGEGSVITNNAAATSDGSAADGAAAGVAATNEGTVDTSAK